MGISASLLILAFVAGLLVGAMLVFLFLVRKIRALEELSMIDDLTELHNSRFFSVSLTREIERAKRYENELSLALLDIDRFKEVNEAYGYEAGDALLKEVAGLLRKRVRAADEVFRYKRGDEFAILSSDTTIPGAISLAERLRQDIERRDFALDVPSSRKISTAREGLPSVMITASVGVACLDRSRDTADMFTRRAESALERAKRSTNVVVSQEPEEIRPR